MSDHSKDIYYEPKQVIKSFKMGVGIGCSTIAQKTGEYLKAEKELEVKAQNKLKSTDFGFEVIMTGENVRVNLYNANDRDAVTFGIYHERMSQGKL